MKQTLLVKHAVSGRLFFDTRLAEIDYTVSERGEGREFAIRVKWSDLVADLLACKEELNVFLFHEYENRPTLKVWHYVKDGPVAYDRESGVLTIFAQSRISYYPHEYSQ